VDTDELKKQTKYYGLRVIKLVEVLPRSEAALVIGNQLLRSGTAMDANYRSACRARSKPDFISKVSIALEEADESLYWMEMLTEAGILSQEHLLPLMREADEIVAILAASVKTARISIKQRG